MADVKGKILSFKTSAFRSSVQRRCSGRFLEVSNDNIIPNAGLARLISAVGAESKISAQILSAVAAPDITFSHCPTFLIKNHAAFFTH